MIDFEILEAYVELRREVSRVGAAEIKETGLGRNQIGVLYRLSLSNATMGELAEYSFADKASTTRTISLLEKAGLVKRSIDKNDKRVVNIHLTASGKLEARKAAAMRNSIGKKLENSLSAHDRKQFVALIQKAVANLKEK